MWPTAHHFTDHPAAAAMLHTAVATLFVVACALHAMVPSARAERIWDAPRRHVRCDRPRTDGLMREPLNALTNFAFLYAALDAALRPHGAVRGPTREGWAAAMVFVAVGSFWHHACECPAGDNNDLYGQIFAGAALLAVVFEHTEGPIAAGFFFVVGAALVLVAARSSTFMRANIEYMVPAATVLVTVQIYRLWPRMPPGRARYVFAWLAVTIVAWLPEEALDNCTFPFLHALFHVALGVALAQIFALFDDCGPPPIPSTSSNLRWMSSSVR